MSDALTTISHLINSPPGQLAAGGVLAGIVWKFFERVEAVLTADTKLEIAVWLLRNTAAAPPQLDMPKSIGEWVSKALGKVLPTEESFKSTWKVFGLVTCILAAFSLLEPHSIARQILAVDSKDGGFDASKFFGSFFFTSFFAALGTHLALIATKRISERVTGRTPLWRLYALSLLNLLLTLLFAALAIVFLLILGSFDPDVRLVLSNWVDRGPTVSELWSCATLAVTRTFPFFIIVLPIPIASVFTAQWVSAGIVLRALVIFFDRFTLLQRWFYRIFDIKGKPLQSIGLVAGALVALVYWTAVMVSRVL